MQHCLSRMGMLLALLSLLGVQPAHAFNSPTNYAGATGSINVSGVPTRAITWGAIKARALGRS